MIFFKNSAAFVFAAVFRLNLAPFTFFASAIVIILLRSRRKFLTSSPLDALNFNLELRVVSPYKQDSIP